MKELVNKSKEISYLLRHNPKGLEMDENGYVSVDDLLEKVGITIEDLEYIVENNDKKRFGFSDDRLKIRASQGHSIDINIEMKLYDGPNKKIFHGTDVKNMKSIKERGLIPMKRQYVHMTDNISTAIDTALRYAKKKDNVVILQTDTNILKMNGIKVYISDNNVYQISEIPFKFLEIKM